MFGIIVAFFIGAFMGVVIMCMLQINRVNDYEREIAVLQKKLNEQK